MPSLWKRPVKCQIWNNWRFFTPCAWACEKISMKLHSIESRVVTGTSGILFGSVYGCTFEPRNFTCWGSEGVNLVLINGMVIIPACHSHTRSLNRGILKGLVWKFLFVYTDLVPKGAHARGYALQLKIKHCWKLLILNVVNLHKWMNI